MNSELQELYSSKWETLTSSIKPIFDDEKLEIKPTNPLLIYFDDEEGFQNAEIRLMIFGQETNSWYDKFGGEIKPVLECYNEFFNEEDWLYYGGQFWNGVNRFLSSLKVKFPDKKIRFVWNNVVKIGKLNDKGFPPDYIYEVERQHFSVIQNELQIIKPNVVLFLSGPNYDSVLTDNFGPLEYQPIAPFSERQLSKVKLENVDFAFRTYHPNFLWRNDIDNYFDAIINEIKI